MIFALFPAFTLKDFATVIGVILFLWFVYLWLHRS